MTRAEGFSILVDNHSDLLSHEGGLASSAQELLTEDDDVRGLGRKAMWKTSSSNPLISVVVVVITSAMPFQQTLR